MSEYSVELKGLNKVYSNLLKEDTNRTEGYQPPDPSGGSLFLSSARPAVENRHFCGSLETLINRPPVRSSIAAGQTSRWGFVFQDSVLLPWKNVRQNAEFPLVIQKKQTKENEEKLDELLELAGFRSLRLRFRESFPAV